MSKKKEANYLDYFLPLSIEVKMEYARGHHGLKVIVFREVDSLALAPVISDGSSKVTLLGFILCYFCSGKTSSFLF